MYNVRKSVQVQGKSARAQEELAQQLTKEIFAELDEQISQAVMQVVDPNGLRVWSCVVCQKTSKEKRDLLRHVEIHYSLEQNCNYCGKTAKNREALRTHIKTYHRQSSKQHLVWLYFCNRLNIFWLNLNFLTGVPLPALEDQIIQSIVQLVDESGNRIWSCSLCSKTMKGKADIKRHVETHLSVEQTCGYCGKMAKNSEALRTHIKTYHRRAPHAY